MIHWCCVTFCSLSAISLEFIAIPIGKFYVRYVIVGKEILLDLDEECVCCVGWL